MNIIKNPRVKVPLRLSIVVISIVETTIIFSLFPEYAGVISYDVFINLILVQIFLVFLLTGNEAKKYTDTKSKLVTFFSMVVFVSVPFFIYAAIPKYTYDNGKVILAEHLNEKSDIEFIVNNEFSPRIPVMPYPKGFLKGILIDNEFYYYEIKIDGRNRFFGINPLTGYVFELEESFYNY